jgi:ATP-dependent RNA helicase RhlE
MGFIHDIRKIAALIPAKRQTLFFSATMPKEIAELADRFLNNPVKVAVTPVATTAERVDQHVVFVDTPKKQALLHDLVKRFDVRRALVFTRTKHGADRVVRRLSEAGIPAAAIHGNKSQPQRERALAEFKAGRLHLLVATDIAARGIDIDSVSHVVNYDLPNVPESYVHRIGRTARAGAEGMAISFCDREERAYLRDIERITRQKVPVMEAPEGLTAMPVADDRGPRPQQAQRQGRPGQGRPANGQGRPGGQNGHGRPGGQNGQGRPGGASRPAAAADKGRRSDEGTPSRWHAGTSNPSQPRTDARPQRRDNRFGSR